MFLLEVLTPGGYWETVAEFFESAAEAELYYTRQLGGVVSFRVVEAEEV